MILNFLVVFLLTSLFSNIFSMPDFFGDNIDLKNYKHPNSTVYVRSHDKRINLANYYNNLTAEKELLTNLANEYKHIMKLETIGYTERTDFPIRAVMISKNIQTGREILKPMFKFVANLNGPDGVGRALTISLIQLLVYSYGVDPRITRMIDRIYIYVIPTVNVYGFQKSDPGSCEDGTQSHDFYTNGYGRCLDEYFLMKEQFRSVRETSAIKKVIEDNPFVLSGNLQGGAIVASYPFDSHQSGQERPGEPVLTYDDAVFKKLAKDYADRNQMMKPGTACGNFFPGGITNGHQWRTKYYGMQDYNYLRSNCFEITLYLGCCKFPPPEFLPFYWNSNLESMLNFIENTRLGIYGLVTDQFGYRITSGVSITQENSAYEIWATPAGEYWKLLIPGSYNVTARAPAAFDETKTVHLTEKNNYIQVDFSLTRQGVYGFVKNKRGIYVSGVTVTATRGDEEDGTLVTQKTKTSSSGEYSMILEPEYTYTLKARSNEYFYWPTEHVYLSTNEPFLRQDLVISNV